MTNDNLWIGVDLDGTLAEYDGWKGEEHIGNPVPEMLERVKRWIADGKNVRIFTARVFDPEQEEACRKAIVAWCKKHVGKELEITCIKDFGMIELWDDRAVQVEPNTGRAFGKSRVAAINPVSVPDRLRELAKLYQERNVLYGDNYKIFGDVMSGLFPSRLIIKSKDDWNRLGILVQIVSKITRYAKQWEHGGHKDSLDDLSVYSQMLQELDHE